MLKARHLRLGVPAGGAALAAALAIAIGAQEAPAQGHDHTPAESPRRGIVYDGLEPGTGRCANGFRVKDAPGNPCTHGPDPAPPGVDVRKGVSTRELRQERPTAAATAVPCIDDGESGARIHVIYAVAADRPDRYAEAVPIIAGAAGEMARSVEDSATETGGYRTLRFLTSNCELVVDHVTLSPAGDDDIGETAEELTAMDYDRPDRDYVVFADSDVYCGIGYVGGQFARADTQCWDGHTALHELTHNLGAVSLDAPYSSGGWHCIDEYDLMCYTDEPLFPEMVIACPEASHERLLDCDHDDYFSTAPQVGNFLWSHPEENTADHPLLADLDGAAPVFLPAAPPGYRGPVYEVRADNSDDDLCVYATRASDGARVRLFCVGYLGERRADVTGALVALAEGDPTAELRLFATDRGGLRSFGFTVWKDDTPILDETDGAAGTSSSTRPLGDPDPLTGWPVFYEQSLTLDLNAPPRAAFTYAPTQPVAGQGIAFSSTSADPDGFIASHSWDLDGDGEFDDASGSKSSRSFAAAGAHTVGLRVVDDRGRAATISRTLQVLPEQDGGEDEACSSARAQLDRVRSELQVLRRKVNRERKRLTRRYKDLKRRGWPAKGTKKYNRDLGRYNKDRLRANRKADRVSELRDDVFVYCP